jgi:hypothetical protein
MVEIMHWLDRDPVAIFVEGGPFFLFGIAWLALGSHGRVDPLSRPGKPETRRPGGETKR